MKDPKATGSQSPRVLLIGCGWVIENVWLPLLQAAGAHVVCVVDPDPQRRQIVERMVGSVRAYADLVDEAVQDCELAFICSPNANHLEHALFSLNHGLHVVLEKPACFDREQAALLISASRLRQRGLWVTSATSWRDDVRYLAHEVAAGTVGEIDCIDISWRRRAGIPRPGSWFTRRADALCGSGGDLGWHLLEVGLGLLGFPEIRSGISRNVTFGGTCSAMAAGWRGDQSESVDAEMSVDRELFGALITEAGAIVRISTAWASHQPWDETAVTVYGRNAELALRNTFGFSTDRSPKHEVTVFRQGLVAVKDFADEDRITPYRESLVACLTLLERARYGDQQAICADHQKFLSLGGAMGALYVDDGAQSFGEAA